MDGESFISANGTEIIDKQFSSIDVTISDEESVVVSGSSFTDCVVCLKDVLNLEITICTFKNTSFVISLDDPAIFVENCLFDGCEFKSICITGLSNQSELVDNELNNCSLKEANIKSDISVLGGNIKNSEVSTFIGKLNMLMDLHVEDCKGSFVEIDCAVLKCEFVRSTVDDLKHIGKIG